MAVKKLKKDFDMEKMYSKIMPSFVAPAGETGQEEPAPAPAAPLREEAVQRPGWLLRNYMEDIVLEKLEQTMTTLRLCTCEKCKKDVMAVALNELPSAYRAVSPDEVEDTVEQLRAGYDIKVTAALIKAVQRVKGFPRHNPEE